MGEETVGFYICLATMTAAGMDPVVGCSHRIAGRRLRRSRFDSSTPLVRVLPLTQRSAGVEVNMGIPLLEGVILWLFHLISGSWSYKNTQGMSLKQRVHPDGDQLECEKRTA